MCIACRRLNKHPPPFFGKTSMSHRIFSLTLLVAAGFPGRRFLRAGPTAPKENEPRRRRQPGATIKAVPYDDVVADAETVEGFIKLHRKDMRLYRRVVAGRSEQGSDGGHRHCPRHRRAAVVGRHDVGLRRQLDLAIPQSRRPHSDRAAERAFPRGQRHRRRKRPSTWPTPTASCSACRSSPRVPAETTSSI